MARDISTSKEYTARFEPWFCRILVDLGAEPVGVDFGNLERDVFIHNRVDLGVSGALDFFGAFVLRRPGQPAFWIP